MRAAYRVRLRNLKEGVHLEDTGLDGRVILKWDLNKWARRSWAGLVWLRIAICGGLL